MLALGRLAQISRRFKKYDDALRYAQEGFECAVEADNLREQALFKGDEARVNLGQRENELALKAAQEYLDLARIAHDETMEANAYGIIAEALVRKGSLDAALEKVNAGLSLARHLGLKSEERDLLVGLENIKALIKGRQRL